MRLVLVAALLFPLLVGCGPNEVEVKFKSDYENLTQLKNRMMSGDITYIKENAENFLTVDLDVYVELKKTVDVQEAVLALTDIRNLVKSVENSAMRIALTSEGAQQTAALELLKRSSLVGCKSKYLEERGEECLRISNADRLDAFEKVELGNMLGSHLGLSYNTNDQEFIRDELCRAVVSDNFDYTVLLISLADFDVGLLRCIRGENTKAYRGSGGCPRSLRREAGENAKRDISRRVSAWKQNLEREGAFDSESIKELKGKIGRSFDGLPDLAGVYSMNSLLDKYDKWNRGGECTTDDLLKSGVTLPEKREQQRQREAREAEERQKEEAKRAELRKKLEEEGFTCPPTAEERTNLIRMALDQGNTALYSKVVKCGKP